MNHGHHQQHHCPRTDHENHDSKSIQIYGSTLPLALSAIMPNVSFSISGVAVPTTTLIMPANIIPRNITKQSIHFISRTLYHVNELLIFIQLSYVSFKSIT
jgi:hypothetical protein